MQHLLLILFVLLASGCATTEIINKIPVPKTQEQSQVTVCRQKIFYGDAAATVISLDRRPILRSAAGKCFSANVSLGPHILSVMAQGPAGPDIREHEFVLQSGTEKFFKTRYEEIIEITAAEIAAFSGYEQMVVQ